METVAAAGGCPWLCWFSQSILVEHPLPLIECTHTHTPLWHPLQVSHFEVSSYLRYTLPWRVRSQSPASKDTQHNGGLYGETLRPLYEGPMIRINNYQTNNMFWPPFSSQASLLGFQLNWILWELTLRNSYKGILDTLLILKASIFLKLLRIMRIHNIFHASQLKPVSDRTVEAFESEHPKNNFLSGQGK